MNIFEPHSIIIWFNDNYKRIKVDSNEETVLTLKSIFSRFIKSDYYQTLNPITKKKTTFCYFKKLINFNGWFKGDCIEATIRTSNKKRIHKYYKLKGWELKMKIQQFIQLIQLLIIILSIRFNKIKNK